ncbi:MAG: hypothetical protein WC071_11840 [Victivallaceae bacterium]
MNNIKHCFCQYSPKVLIKWIRRRFIDNVPTVELMYSVGSKEEIEAISLVGLIEGCQSTPDCFNVSGLPTFVILHPAK